MNPQTPSTGSSVNIVRAGPTGKTPVVLLHAASMDLTYWDAQFEALSQTHDVVAFDWPGHGRSGGISGQIHFEDWAEVVASVVRKTGVESAHIVGISMGSMVAQYFALNHPEMVRSLCLIGSACTLPGPVRQAMQERAAKARREGMQAVLAMATGHWFTPEFRQRRPDVIDRVEKTFLAFEPGQYAALWEMIATLETRERLVDLVCPTLMLVGEQDTSTPPAAARLIGEQVKDARVEIIPGASHMATLEAPEMVNRLIATFISQA